MSGRDEELMAGVAPGLLFPWRVYNSWVDSKTGAFRIGAVHCMAMSSRATMFVIAQDWHSRKVTVLNDAEVGSIRPYPSEPIPDPEART